MGEYGGKGTGVLPPRWFVRIDGWQPTPLNQLMNCHWALAGRKKKHDAEIIKVACLGADVPKAERKRRVSLEIILGPRQRGCDRDAYWKSLLDALVKAGALVDDSPTWCELGEVTYSRGARKACVICLESRPDQSLSGWTKKQLKENPTEPRVLRLVTI